MNIQKPEPRAQGDGSTLDVHSVFFTIQGEGMFAGRRAIFVRLAGCNLQCPACDTEYTEGRGTFVTRHLANYVENMARENNAAGCLVVITGGEPLRQNLSSLVLDLINRCHIVQIESNGVFALPDELKPLALMKSDLFLVISPKTAKVHPSNEKLAAAYKYVLSADAVGEDGLPILALAHPTKGQVARPPYGMPVYLNPMDAKDEETNAANLAAVTRSCLAFNYILGIQLHKLIKVN